MIGLWLALLGCGAEPAAEPALEPAVQPRPEPSPGASAEGLDPTRLATPPVADPTAPLVVVLGDGRAFGVGVEAAQAWPAVLAAETGLRVLNASAPGARVRDLAAWCEAEGAGLGAAALIWSADPHPRDPPPFDSWSNSLRRCQVATAAPAWVLMPPSTGDSADARRNADARERALQARTAALGGTWVALGQPVDLVGPEHPSAAGHGIIAATLAPALGDLTAEAP